MEREGASSAGRAPARICAAAIGLVGVALMVLFWIVMIGIALSIGVLPENWLGVVVLWAIVGVEAAAVLGVLVAAALRPAARASTMWHLLGVSWILTLVNVMILASGPMF